jgi:hypothetical protein
MANLELTTRPQTVPISPMWLAASCAVYVSDQDARECSNTAISAHASRYRKTQSATSRRALDVAPYASRLSRTALPERRAGVDSIALSVGKLPHLRGAIIRGRLTRLSMVRSTVSVQCSRRVLRSCRFRPDRRSRPAYETQAAPCELHVFLSSSRVTRPTRSERSRCRQWASTGLGMEYPTSIRKPHDIDCE